MAKNKVVISKVNIKIGDKEIELSLEEAKELKDILNETFGAKVVYPTYPVVTPIPLYVSPYPHWYYWQTTVSNTDTFTLTTSTGTNSLQPQ